MATTEEVSDGGKRGVQSSSKPAAQTGTFAVRGDYWSLGYGGPTFPLKDLKGLSYIQRLLQHPGEEFHSLDLLSGTTLHAESGPLTSARTEGTDAVGGLGDSGEMLDAQAKQAYKRKLRELNQELEEERERGNDERAEELKSDIDFINRELARAVGLGGRDRRAGSASERARLNVKRAITGALQKISEQQASMGELLDRSIKTGSFCSYAPDPQDQVTWQFSIGTAEASRAVASSEPLISPRETSLLRSLSERSAFVGREAESAMLRRFLNQAQGGAGRVVMISGAAGVGKTRIAQEFGIEASQKGFLVRAGSCYDRGDSVAFIPFVEILEEALTQAPSPQAFRDALGNDASEIARLLPQLRRLFPDIPPPLEIPPEQSRRLLFHAAAEFLTRIARSRPVVLLIDDLQWADEGTSSLLSYLAPLIAKMPVLIVGTYRDSEVDHARPLAKTLDELIRLHAVERLSLAGLPQNAVAEMLRALSGREAPQKLVSLIYSETEGNPFFVEELYYHLVEQGRLLDSAGEFRRDLRIEDVDLPRSLRLVIGRHLARVGAETQKILGAAAVIGRSFTFELLEASTRMGPDRLLDQVEEAERAGLIYSTLNYPDARFRFSHELIRQAVISQASVARRQRLHLDVAAALERLNANTIEEAANELAYHLQHAGAAADCAKTIRYLSIAARRARLQGALTETGGLYRDALAVLGRMPETPERDQLELGLQLGLGAVLMATRGYTYAETAAAYQRATSLGERLGDPLQVVLALTGLASQPLLRGELDTAQTLADQVLAVSQHDGKSKTQIWGYYIQGVVRYHRGNLASAWEHLSQARAAYLEEEHRKNPQDPGSEAMEYMALTSWQLGMADTARACIRDAIMLNERIRKPYASAHCHFYAAYLHAMLREPTATQEFSEKAVKLAEERSIPLYFDAGRILYGWAIAQQGRGAEGVKCARSAIESFKAAGNRLGIGSFFGFLAEALARTGALDEAIAAVEEGLSLALGEPADVSYLMWLRGELLLEKTGFKGTAQVRDFEKSRVDEVEDGFQKARSLALGIGARSYALRAATSLGRLLVLRGHRSAAREMVEPIFESIAEGFDTHDVTNARELLEQLGKG